MEQIVSDENLGGMELSLVQHMGSDDIIANAARVSTNSDNQDKPIEGLIRYLARERHMSPFEHTSITYMVTAPMFVRDQWVRHRTQSYNCLSFRYSEVDSAAFGEDSIFYYPPIERSLVNSGSSANPVFETENTIEEYANLINTLQSSYRESLEAYKYILSTGAAPETARYVMPAATMTRFYATANLRNWEGFVKERTASNAQWEIKKLAELIDGHLGDLYPVAWSALRTNQSRQRAE